MSNREQFEAWYKKDIDASADFFICEEGFYDDHDVQIAWRGYQAAIAAQAKQPVDSKVIELLKSAVKEIQQNTCSHEETHRGGTIWEICSICGCKWADDEGGKPEFVEAKIITDINDFLLAAQAQQSQEIGEMRENGVNWYGKNPHAFEVGTKFFALPPAQAQQPSKTKPYGYAVEEADGEVKFFSTFDRPAESYAFKVKTRKVVPLYAQSQAQQESQAKRLQAAIEGECGGLAIDLQTAKKILNYVLLPAPEGDKE